jgi:chorismate mutase
MCAGPGPHMCGPAGPIMIGPGVCHNAAPMRLFALRGANTVERNEADAILSSTDALMRELMERNSLAADQIVSCIFTMTGDLDAEFPAVAARRLGLDRVPLLCAREVAVPGSLPRVIRVLVHYYAPEEHSPRHSYLGEARTLRSDLEAAQ